MPKILSANSAEGLEVLAAYNTGQKQVESAPTEIAYILGSFTVRIDCEARVESIGSLPLGGTGRVWLYDATEGEIAERNVQNSSVTMTNPTTARRLSSKLKLLAGKLYQVRASCVDATSEGVFVIEGIAPVDV